MEQGEFVERVEKVKQKLYRIAYLYVGNEASALECVDEAVYKGYKAVRQLKEDSYFETWLTRILINECKKELRRATRWSFEKLPETSEVVYDTLPLKEAIGKLKRELKEVIILRYFEGYTLAETACVLKIPQGTVVTRQRRALQLLRLALTEEVHDES